MNKNIDIGGRLHSTATGNIVAGANEIFDDDKNKKQSEINTETYTLVNEVNAKLDGLSPEQQGALDVATKANNNETKLGYYVCGTEGDSAAKVISNATGYILSKGGSIKVKMTNANSANNATLNINSTGAKALYYDGERASANNSWAAGETVEVYYDGTSYYANNVAGGNSSGDRVFDISAKTGNSYETLNAALTAANSILPVSKKRGGMSIKFIQSSDNKYVQYRLMAGEWSTNTDDWAIADEGVYTDNPEFIYVKTDAKNKILWAIKINGDIYYGAGVPQQVIDYIEKKIADLSLDEYEDIVAFLDDLEKGDKTLSELLAELLDTKVDKEEGKSLIDSEFAEGVHYIESPEFAEIKLDAEERILEATYKDGTKLLPAGVKVNGVVEYDGATIKTVENPEFAAVWLDNDEHILFGVQTDGNFLFGCGVPKQVKEYIEQKIEELPLDEYESIVTFIGDYLNSTTLEELLNKKVDGEYVDNFDFIEVITDNENKILSSIRKNGSHYVYNLHSETLDAKVDKEDGKSLIPTQYIQEVKNQEFIKVLIDGNDNIIEAIGVNGVKAIYLPLSLKGCIIDNNNSYGYLYLIKSYNDKVLFGIDKNGHIENYNYNKLENTVEQIEVSTFKSNYFENYGYIPFSKLNTLSNVLLYSINGIAYDNLISYPTGELFYSNGGKIYKVSINGETNVILEPSGVSGYRCLYMDSNLNLYACATVSENGNINSGIYKLVYGESSFTHVLSLNNPSSDIHTESNPNKDTIWTMTEDKDGRIYAGVYTNSQENPSIYRSDDNGNIWNHIFNFNTSGLTTNGKHIHFIIYNKYDNSLYVVVGEINQLFKSVDFGETWTPLNIFTENAKGTSALVVPNGILIGSDDAYDGTISKVYGNGSIRTVARWWANVVFAIRQSDITNYIYAFTQIDVSASQENYFPPVAALSDQDVLDNWKSSSHNTRWENYNRRMSSVYPSDSIRPTHYGILISKDNGETWEIFKTFEANGGGFNVVGQFRNGECAAGLTDRTIVISEGKHKFTSSGFSVDDELYGRLSRNRVIDIL